jgi:hypothetical protein
MSQGFISENDRRFFRLKLYFKPYRYLHVETNPSLDQPYAISSKESSSSYQIQVSPYILRNDAPDWIEPALLRIALDEVKSNQVDFESEQHKSRLRELFEQAREQQKEEEKKLAEQLQQLQVTEGPDIAAIWKSLRLEYFPDRADIDDYRVLWSKRKQTSCLASCSIGNRRIYVASAMRLPDSQAYLEPLIYHEMCHAILGPPKIVRGRRIMHGRDFKALERRHPEIKALNHWIKAGGWTRATQIENSIPK